MRRWDTKDPNPHITLNTDLCRYQSPGQGSQYIQVPPTSIKKPSKYAISTIATMLEAILSFRCTRGASTGTSNLSGHLSPAAVPRNNSGQKALGDDSALATHGARS